MNDKDTIGIKFTADTVDFKTGLKEANAEIKKSNDEFKAASAGLDNWQKSTDGLTLKIKSLNSNLSQQEKIIKGYKDEIERVTKQSGDHTAQLQRLNEKLRQAENRFKTTKGEIAKFTNQLNKVATEKLKAGLDSLNKSLATVAKSVTVAFGAVVGGAVGIADATRDSRKSMNQLYTAFSDLGLKTDDVNKIYQKFYGVLGDDATAGKALASLSNLARSQEDLNKWLNISTGLYATFGDNLPVDALAKAANETAKTGKASGNLSKVLKQAGLDVDDFEKKLSSCRDTQERTALITDTLEKRFSTAADTFRETNKSIIEANEVNNEFGNRLQEIGDVVEPLANDVKRIAAQLLKDLMPTIQAIGEKLQKGLPDIVTGIKNLIPIVTSLTTAVLAYKAAMVLDGVIKGIKSLITALKLAKTAQQALNLAMASNPAGALAAAIGLLVGAIGGFIVKSKLANKEIQETEKAVKNANSAIKEYTNSIEEYNTAKTEAAKVAAAQNEAKKWQEVKEALKGNISVTNTYYKLIDDIEKGVRKLSKDAVVEKAFGKNEKLKNTVLSLENLSFQLLQSGFNTSQLSEKLADLGLDTAAVNRITAEATKQYKDYIEAQKEAAKDTGKKDTKPSPIVTMLEADLKAYNEYNKRLAEKEYKINTDPKGSTEWLDLQLKANETGYQRYKKYLDDKKAADKQALLDKEKDIAKLLDEQENLNNNILISDKQRQQEQIQLEAKGKEARLTEFRDLLIQMKNDGEAFTVGQASLYEKLVGDPEKVKKDFKETLDEISNEFNKWSNVVTDICSHISNTITAVIDLVSDYWNDYYDEQLKHLEEQSEEQEKASEHDLSEIEKQYMNYEITLEEFLEKKKEIEAEQTANEAENEQAREAEKERIERERDAKAEEIFNANKGTQIAMLWIQSLVGQTTALITSIRDLGPIAGAITGAALASAILAETIANTALIASQKYTPAFAKGGIIDKPTVGLVGEAGKEAIMPLENNTEWIRELAFQLAEIQGLTLPTGTQTAGTNNYNNYNNSNQSNFTQIINAPKTPSRLDLYRDGKRLLSLNRNR